MNYKFCAISVIVILVFDFVWLGMVASNFYRDNLSEVARIVDGSIKPVYWSAAVVYFLLAVGLTIFVEPQVDSWKMALLYGCLFGAVTYGVYDFTNHATLKQYPLQLLFADLTWGTFVCGVGSTVGYLFSRS